MLTTTLPESLFMLDRFTESFFCGEGRQLVDSTCVNKPGEGSKYKQYVKVERQ